MRPSSMDSDRCFDLPTITTGRYALIPTSLRIGLYVVAIAMLHAIPTGTIPYLLVGGAILWVPTGVAHPHRANNRHTVAPSIIL